LTIVGYVVLRHRVTLRRRRRRAADGGSVGLGALATNGRGSRLRRSDQQGLTVSASQLVGIVSYQVAELTLKFEP
jgi:hypothetical protein